jgi:AraC-like DNA-binding protein
MPILTYSQIVNLPILRQFYTLAWRLFGVNIAIISPDLKHSLSINSTDGWNPFCVNLRRIVGEKQCVSCDLEHARHVGVQRNSLRYKCWAGLREFIVPIVLDGEILAYIQCGQVMDHQPLEEDWIATRRAIQAHGFKDSPNRELFFSQRVILPQTQEDLMALLELFGNYIAYAQDQMLLSETSRQWRIEERALSYIRNHMADTISLDEIAEAAYTSKRNLSRVFRERTGMTVLEVIHEVRIAEACRLLQVEDATVAKTALDCGFGSVQQFDRVFRKLKLISPQAWQRQHKDISSKKESEQG